MEHYKATLEQWNRLETGSLMQSSLAVYILELRARVEALEAAQRPASKVYEISKPLQLTPEQAQQINDLLAPEPRRNHPAKPDSSLVERVRKALNYPPEPYARAAIREVTAWLKETHGWSDGSLMRLEQEAER